MIFTMKLFSLGVIVTNVITPIVVVDAFSSASGVINQRIQTRTQTRARQPSQQPSSLLPPLAYLMRQGDDIDTFNNDDSKRTTTTATTAPSTSIPTNTRTRTDMVGTINLNNYVDEKMIEDLQNQHRQMMEMQQQHQHQSSYSVTIPLPQILLPSTSPTPTETATITTAVATNNYVEIYGQIHDDLTYLNIQLLRSKVSFMYRLLPKNKQSIERFVNFLIKFIL
mmetsp:Transcript_8794/g.8622  ORF Transcript_8794/g.8622 Transcript_8794/m.8622 type:complete len:224 (+) Transcript_8794:86-757(+)